MEKKEEKRVGEEKKKKKKKPRGPSKKKKKLILADLSPLFPFIIWRVLRGDHWGILKKNLEEVVSSEVDFLGKILGKKKKKKSLEFLLLLLLLLFFFFFFSFLLFLLVSSCGCNGEQKFEEIELIRGKKKSLFQREPVGTKRWRT